MNYVSNEDLAKWIRNGESVCVVDVRDDDCKRAWTFAKLSQI